MMRLLNFPGSELRRLVNDDDWDFGPAIKERAQWLLENEDLPEYPDEMRETFAKLLSEHGIDSSKYLPDEG